MTGVEHGLPAIAAMFAAARAKQRAAFLPYFPIGYPSYAESLDAITTLAELGADGFEIGVPFSDPLADGPVIQAATQTALSNGITVRRCLDAVRELRLRGVMQPMLLMSYLNPLLAYGPGAFVTDAKAAGADGVIIPDLPVEEAAEWSAACRRHNLAQILFLAPTSNAARIEAVAAHASGFLYLVSVTGVTGARSDLPPDIASFIARVRARAGALPLVLGFGISSAAHVRQIEQLTDGFIVGSALVKAAQGGVAGVRAFATELRGM